MCNGYMMINTLGGRFIKELQSAAKVERIELQKDRDIYEQYAGFYGRYAHIAGDFPCRLHAVYLLLRLVSSRIKYSCTTLSAMIFLNLLN